MRADRPAAGMARPCAVDLFCGAGGLSYGLKSAGIDVAAGIDSDPACKHPFESNVKARFVEMDAKDLTPEFVESLFAPGSPRILAGCAPCQPFSCYNPSGRGGNKRDLLSRFGDLAERVLPDVVAMENVPGLAKYPVFEKFVGALRRAGYGYDYRTVNCAKYGIPQTRRRLVLLASRRGPIRLQGGKRGRRATVWDAIRHTEPIRAGESSGTDRLHKGERPVRQELGEDPQIQARRVVARLGRGAQDPVPQEGCRQDVRQHLRPHGMAQARAHHHHAVLRVRDRQVRASRAAPRHIPARGGPAADVPKNYSFVADYERVSIHPVARLIGNAVPVELGRAIGRSIARHLELPAAAGGQAAAAAGDGSTVRHPELPAGQRTLFPASGSRQGHSGIRGAMAGDHAYTMRVGLDALRHLGAGLHGSIPAALAEAVANAWDADAGRVDIRTGPGGTITIQDDGSGMTVSDANEKYCAPGTRAGKRGRRRPGAAAGP